MMTITTTRAADAPEPAQDAPESCPSCGKEVLTEAQAEAQDRAHAAERAAGWPQVGDPGEGTCCCCEHGVDCYEGQCPACEDDLLAELQR